MQILVTGGAGDIGGHLLELFGARGHDGTMPAGIEILTRPRRGRDQPVPDPDTAFDECHTADATQTHAETSRVLVIGSDELTDTVREGVVAFLTGIRENHEWDASLGLAS